MEREFATRCVHVEDEDTDSIYGSLSYPIFQTATFAHPGVGQSSGYDYTRTQNPTKEHLEKIVASLEKGVGAVAFASGMAAIDTALELFGEGDHIIADIDLYGGTYRLLDTVCRKNGLKVTIADLAEESLSELIRPETRAVYIETPTNPMMHILDIEELSSQAHQNSAILIVDNTFFTPYLQNPIEHGADLVVHSGTKYLGGHNDTLCGVVVAGDADLLGRIRILQNTKGNGIAPFDSWLIARGIQTLPIRMDRAQDNARRLACYLRDKDGISRVLYPGFASPEQQRILQKQAWGTGSMITFEVKDKALALRILERVRIISFAESLGGTESLITYPITQTHSAMPENILAHNGINDRILRLSVGIEAVQDLIEDLEQAIE